MRFNFYLICFGGFSHCPLSLSLCFWLVYVYACLAWMQDDVSVHEGMRVDPLVLPYPLLVKPKPSQTENMARTPPGLHLPVFASLLDQRHGQPGPRLAHSALHSISAFKLAVGSAPIGESCGALAEITLLLGILLVNASEVARAIWESRN